MKSEYFVSCSFGADSTATAILAIEKGEPLSALVYCEIMFDKGRSAEVPEHRDFIYNTAIPYFEQHGVKTIVLRSEKTADDACRKCLFRDNCGGEPYTWGDVEP